MRADAGAGQDLRAVFNGRRFRVLDIIDDFLRECVGQVVDVLISGIQVTRYLDELAKRRGLPKVIVYDSDPEFSSKDLSFGRETPVSSRTSLSRKNRPRMTLLIASTASPGTNT